jgi:eukaryotic translation initiation factor 2C
VVFCSPSGHALVERSSGAGLTILIPRGSGTARPAHYTVLLDEIFREKKNGQAAADDLEKLTHNLCYLFGRATKAVSICPPAYYADILCTRARVHRPKFDGSDTASTATESTEGLEAAGPIAHPRIADSMYYI